MTASILRRQLGYRLRRLGTPGLAGLVLLMAALSYLLAMLIPLGLHGDAQDQRIAAAATRLHAAEQASSSRTKTPTEQLMDFYRTFPKGTTIPDWLSSIYTIADEQKLSLEVGEYSLTQVKSGRLDQFSITLPVKGSYPQIRKFIGAALATAPALALDSLDLKRDKVGEGTVDARIVFLLYLEKGE